MYRMMRSVGKKIGANLRFGAPSIRDSVAAFHSDDYLRHNARRLEHLASLGISFVGKSVLEVGAGIGDHTHFFIDRGCVVTITDARPSNVAVLRSRYPSCRVQLLDMERPERVDGAPFDVTHCYGLLYHLARPAEALDFLGRSTGNLLLLETCVSFGDELAVNATPEEPDNPTQANSGLGCRPTRPWIFGQLQQHFEYVYIPKTQPYHEQFPLDWSDKSKHGSPLQRAVFVASRMPIDSELLAPRLLNQQSRHV